MLRNFERVGWALSRTVFFCFEQPMGIKECVTSDEGILPSVRLNVRMLNFGPVLI